MIEDLTKKEALIKNYVELTPRDFIEILNSRKFRGALTLAAREVRLTGYETGFKVDILQNKEFKISDVKKGSTDRMDSGSETIGVIDADSYFDSTFGELLAFHFHPKSRGRLQPSDYDLDMFDDPLGPTLMGVGMVSENGDVEMLLVASPYKNPLQGFDQSYLYDNSVQKSVWQELKREGLDSMPITYYQKRNKALFLTEQSLDRLLGISLIRVEFVNLL